MANSGPPFPPTAFNEVDAPYGVHEYSVYATGLVYWDQDFVTIDHQPTPFVRGDANGNGTVEGLADTIFILDYAFSDGPEPPCMVSADSNGDGIFQALTDALFIMYYAYAGGPPTTGAISGVWPE